MSRGFTRTTRNPSRLSSGGRDGSWRDVTTVTSCPRAASSRDRERTWLSTPPRCGENHGETWAILTPRTSENPTARRDVPAGVRPRPEERFLPDDGARVDDGGAFDVGAASDPRARLHEHFTDEGRAAIHIGMVRPLQRGQESRVRTQEIPWPPDIDPLPREAEPVDIARLDQRTDRVRD